MFGSQISSIGPSFRGADFRIPEIANFGACQFRQAALTSDNWQQHQGLEIVFMLEGEGCWELGPRRLAQVSGGHALVFPSGLQHRIINGIYPPSKNFWLILEPFAEGRARSFSDEEFREFEQVAARQSAPIAFGDAIARKLGEIITRMGDPRVMVGAPIVVADLRARIGSLLVDFWQACSLSQEVPRSDLVEQSEEILREEVDHDIHIGELARRAGCSRSRLHATFKRELGMSPVDYRQRLKIKRCCELLQSSELPITSIAVDTGFASTQYFARVFRKYLGTTPSDYRRISRLRSAVAE